MSVHYRAFHALPHATKHERIYNLQYSFFPLCTSRLAGPLAEFGPQYGGRQELGEVLLGGRVTAGQGPLPLSMLYLQRRA